jgi:hypothetical protein
MARPSRNLTSTLLGCTFTSTAAGRQIEGDDVGRLAVVVQDVLIRLAQRVRQQPVAHEASVDVEVLNVSRGPRIRRLGDHAVQAQTCCGFIERERGLVEIFTEQRTYAIDVAVRLDVPADATVMGERECHVGAG